jgi:formate dehydrogenase
MVDLLLRTGPKGDWFGLRPSGLSVAKLLRRHPHGLVLSDHVKTGILRAKLRTASKRIDLAPQAIVSELGRLSEVREEAGEFPLRLIGLRELRSHNSWMHNAPLLMRGERVHALRIHPGDAAEHGLEDGCTARLQSKSGAVEVPVAVTDEMTPGAVALPHGWGHSGGWQVANANAGVNVNLLASGAPEDLEALAGMAHLNGIPVRVSAVSAPAPAAPAGAAAP